MGESAELTSSQQEAEDHLQQSRQAIQDLQAALRNAQVGSCTGYNDWLRRHFTE